VQAVASIDLALIPKRKERGGKIVGQCVECAANGEDGSGEHFVMLANGRWGCAKYSGDGEHRRAIFKRIGRKDGLPASGPCLARPVPKPRRLDLLARIKRDFPACVYDLWDNSPIRPDEDLDDAKAFLRLFPADAVLWIADDVRKTGRPEHTLSFRTRAEWEAETFTAGTRIAPSSFRRGTISRKAANVIRHLFAVVESDTLAKDDFCSVMRWLREACRWHLAAVVDSGNRSLHAWFCHPGTLEVEKLAEHAAALGLDKKLSEPSQPWRLPGVARENATTRQQLFYLDVEAAP
jgi:hypothetical protein